MDEAPHGVGTMPAGSLQYENAAPFRLLEPGASAISTIALLQTLLAAFSHEDILYCYWKSSRRLAAVLAGEADLDLLVAKQDQHRAGRLLSECGFKLFPAVANREHPAILSFLGYDAPSGRILHVHLHTRLVSGERLLRNYRLPWEAAILVSSVRHPASQLRMLDTASEAVLLAVRGCLELRRTDAVTLLHWQATQEKFAGDRTELAGRLDRATLHRRAAEFLQDDTAGLLADAICGPRPWDGERRLRRLVERDLAAHRMYGAVEARLRSVVRTVHWLAGGLNRRYLHAPRPWGRRAPGGGCVVALVGVDGSGKSTVTAAVRSWLGGEINVMPIYFGTGDGRPSLLLLPLKLAAPLFSRLVKQKPRGSSHGSVSSQAPGRWYGVLLMVWSTVLALEKRSKLRAAHRGSARGMVVVADRYPQDENPGYNDGPLLPRLASAPRWLRRFEAGAYALARTLPPDLVIKLDAPAETLAQREPNMDRGVIRERVDAVRRLRFPGARVVRIDATQPLADVLRAVKGEIWSML